MKAMSVLRNETYPDWIVNGGDTRNVIDHYKYWNNLDIAASLDATSFDLIVVAENFAHDFNISSLVRNSNAFNARRVDLLGRRHWDRRGSVGTHHYTPVTHRDNPDEYYARLREEGASIVAVDNIEGAINLPDFTWPEGLVAVVFGQEDIGVSNLALENADYVVQIPQRGSVRSLNVASAGAVVLYDYACKHPDWTGRA